jgi:FkbH-like protein
MIPFIIISDFNASILGRYINSQLPDVEYEIREAPFGQVIPAMMDSEYTDSEGALAVVWARAESVSLSFRKALDLEVVLTEDCLAEVDYFADTVLKFAASLKYCFVAAFSLPPDHYGYGMLEWRPGLGLTQLLARLNLRLAERLAVAPNVYFLDSERWLKASATPAQSKMWYAAKVPFANAVFQVAAADISTAVSALAGKSRRILLLDLDNTLWGGVVGETGWQGIRLGGHDHVGEAFKAFQAKLKGLTRRGVQLGLVSKNEESVALEAVDNHPEMVLSRHDIAGWKINWQDKAQNILDLLAELNLGMASAVFIDDNPIERDRIRSALPELLVPEWPKDPCLYTQALDRLRCFDTIAVTDGDRYRTSMYVADKARTALKASSMKDWLSQLSTRVSVEKVGKSNIPRIEQLFNKTNQLNLSTRRLSAEEILAWASVAGREMFAISVSDKFGDLGLTGIIAIECQAGEATLTDYILSCRVMGRKIEESILHVAVESARRLSARQLVATYLPTERNEPTLKVFKSSGLLELTGHKFSWDCALPFPRPESVTLEFLTNKDGVGG